MAFMVIDRIRKEPDLFIRNRKQILIAFGLTGGLSLLFYLGPGLFSFFSDHEKQDFNRQLAAASAQYASQLRQFMDELEAARISIFRHDAIRSFLFISLAFGLTWLYALKKIRTEWFLAGLALLITADMWMVDRRYLNKDNFITEKQEENKFTPSPADLYILRDPDPYYRVLNLTVSPWQDATTSYHHKSIGGYHGAKLQRFQDLIDGYLGRSVQDIIDVLNAGPTRATVDSVLSAQQVLNMINTKYLIWNPSQRPLGNRFAMGHAWIVEDYRLARNADEEFLSLAPTDLRKVAVVDERFSHLLREELKQEAPAGTVELTEYRPNRVSYRAELDRPSLVVFSTSYYEEGWHAAIDGKPAEHLRADYILNALPVDAGEHEIVFSFSFRPFNVGDKISYAGSWLVLLVLLGGFGYYFYLQFFRKPEKQEG
jgi:hypothetical protein